MNAQKSAIDKVANAACECINNSELDENMTQQDAELFLGQCMAPSIMENMDKLMKEMKLEEFNQESGYQIGLEVGKKLGAICPKFIELSIIMARNATPDIVDEEYESSDEEVTAEIESDYSEDYTEVNSIQGRFVREEGGTQRYIVLNGDGVEEKFLIYRMSFVSILSTGILTRDEVTVAGKLLLTTFVFLSLRKLSFIAILSLFICEINLLLPSCEYILLLHILIYLLFKLSIRPWLLPASQDSFVATPQPIQNVSPSAFVISPMSCIR
jgi:hypothetical protein